MYDQQLADALREIEKLKAENAKLREALKPFADYARTHGIVHLLGRNGANLPGDVWLNATKLV